MTRPVPAVAVLLALLAALAVALPAPASAQVPAGFFGVHADGPLFGPEVDLDGEAALMSAIGVRTVRVAVYWRDIEPRPGRFTWSGYDRVLRAFAARGVRVMPILVRSPPWAAGGDTDEGAVPRRGHFGRFARRIVDRYGRGGVLALPVTHWQVWNEPDIDRYWQGTPWPRTYLRLLREARGAIRRADPRAVVVAAGLTNRSWRSLAQLYRAGGRGAFDAAAIHPFSRRVENVVRIVRLAREAMRDAGDGSTPLLLTEVTWTSGLGQSTQNYGWEVDEPGQAERVREGLSALAAQRRALGIERVFWYTWLDGPRGAPESFAYAGLRRFEGGQVVAKPAFEAFRETIARLTR